MDASINLARNYGSTREGRFCDQVPRWAIGRIREHDGFRLDVTDPAACARSSSRA